MSKQKSKQYQVIIVPSEMDQHLYQNCDNFDKANKIESESKQLFEFDTEIEMWRFLEGYNAGIGYLGDGLSFIKKPK